MKELIVRSISGLLYISIILFSMFASREWFLILLFVLGAFTIYEFQKLIQLKGFIAYAILAALLYILSYLMWNKNAIYVYAILGIIVNIWLLKELFQEKTNTQPIWKKYTLVIFYLIGGFVFLSLIPSYEGNYKVWLIIGIFILIWANDSFAYLVGKNFGKKKLLERVSPKKTVEGFIGGFAGTFLAGFIIFSYTELLSLGAWFFMAIMVTVLGTFGDLIQSKFKRKAGVKDSGSLMPGHGGIYDRLDSIIYVSPFIFAFLEIMHYVS